MVAKKAWVARDQSYGVRAVRKADFPNGVGKRRSLHVRQGVVLLIRRVRIVPIAGICCVIAAPSIALAVPAIGERLPGIRQVSEWYRRTQGLKVDFNGRAWPADINGTHDVAAVGASVAPNCERSVP